MRKMKKINGYLIVKFNDRERQEWDGLGAYGVIDAELYTGHIDVDRGAMEYDDADSIEVAVEQARGLESELDVTEPAATYTVVKETDTATTEDEVDPEGLFKLVRAKLEREIRSTHYPDTDPRTAAHELYGYARALVDTGLVKDNDERFWVMPGIFGSCDVPQPLPREREELLTHICDEVCKAHIPGRTQEELDAICKRCAVEQLANEAEERELHTRSTAHRKLNQQIDRFREAMPERTARRVVYGARKYLEAMADGGLVTERERTTFEAAITDAYKAMPPYPKCPDELTLDLVNQLRQVGQLLKEMGEYTEEVRG